MLRITKQRYTELSNTTDPDLIKIIQLQSVADSRKEVEELYQRHALDVYKMTRSLFDNSPEGISNADDLFQDAWKRAMDKIDRYNPSQNNTFGAWVKGIADNLFLENDRKRKKREKAVDEAGYLAEDTEHMKLSEGDDEPVANMSSLASKKEELAQALKLLTDQEREILLEWHKSYDKNDPGRHDHVDTLKRLALKFGIEPGSVRKTKQRALEKIKKHLGL